MNLRILKKLSKRAAPLLPLLGEAREQFKAEKFSNYIGNRNVIERKHWERMRSIHDKIIGDGNKYPAKDGNGFIAIFPPYHARKGTIMVGGLSGYYEPEWDETTAYEALVDCLSNHFTDWENFDEDEGNYPICSRDLSKPRFVFQAANEAIARAKEPRK